MKTYTVQQVKKYLESQDSFADAIRNCDEQHFEMLLKPKEITKTSTFKQNSINPYTVVSNKG